MPEQMIHVSFSMSEVIDLIPLIVKNAIRLSPAAAKLAEAFNDVEAKVVFQCDNHAYGLVFKGSGDVVVTEGPIENPMVKIVMTMDDLKNIIRVKNAAIFLGKDLKSGAVSVQKSQTMYNTLSGLSGKVTSALTQDDGSVCRITYIFNGVETPQTVISLDMESLMDILTKNDHAVNMFMSGRLQIEGDMTLAMKIQTLF